MSKFFLIVSLIFSFPLSLLANALAVTDGVAVDLGMIHPTITNGDIVPHSMKDLRAMTLRIYIMDMSEEFAEENFCTGVLIAPQVVLTAAHCVAADPSKLMVQVYFQDSELGVEKIVAHPKYEPLRYEEINGKLEARGGVNDVALLFLEQKVKNVTPALLPVQDYRLKEREKVIMAGYGLLGEEANTTGDLYYVKVTVEEIAKARMRVYGKKTSCSGDSGGPLLLKYQDRWMSVGIISTGDCESISTHMRTSAYTEWILNQIEKFTSSFRI